ncbi:MAG: DegT/DnrJ/EryC1/StrS family aminotransferase [Verrucomicrobia bacterium]|nr:DegT/DnrJ/EryC1/StrS family aminotransferase [Verrucomicrobiota bacterium]
MKLSVPYLDLAAQLASIRSEVDAAIARTLDSSAFCLGPEVDAFESEFAGYCGVQHAVGLNSGTSALHLAMLLAGVGVGDEVITTPFTFVATSWAISYVGAVPRYIDIDDATMNLNPDKLQAAIGLRTKAIVPVHLYGHAADLDPIGEIASASNLTMIEDAAQAHGGTYHGKCLGSIGSTAAFSFYPGKNLGAIGEGGALVTNNPELAARARSLRNHGSSVRYYHDEIGYNYRMEGIQAAVLRVKLRHLDAWTAARRRVAHRYQELLADTPLKLPQEAAYAQSAWHLFVVRHPERDALMKFLESRQIGCALHYPLPLHLQKCYQGLGHRIGDFPVAEKAANECLSLPIYPELSDDQIETVASAVRVFFNG